MLAEGRSLVVEEDADRGHCLATIFVDELDARVAEIAVRGLDPDERLTPSRISSATAAASSPSVRPEPQPNSRP